MACALSIQDYLSYFLLKPQESKANEDGKNSCQPGSLLVATVHKYEKGGGESIFYSKRTLGNKQNEPISMFVQDMMGDAGNV